MSSELLTPPNNRTLLGQVLTVANKNGELVLQHCQDCHTVQYPPREVCKHCLSDALDWRSTENSGEVLAASELHNSLEPYFQQHLPWLLTTVKLDCGLIVLCHGTDTCSTPGTRVRVITQCKDNNQAILVATLDLESP